MGFKKVLISDGRPIIIGSTKEEYLKFLPGFSYRIGGLIYTVKEDVTQEANSPTREVIVSDGSVEIMLVTSIKRDLKESDCQILPLDMKYAKTVEKKETKKTTAKKKIVKKKVVKKKKKNANK